ncbi:MAG: hypothetical protein KatS3mg119_1545 [Rhodothalassiaceae bacterium]|nr:MAG: hypothetical protein KatS3mg119_1545 [Rhodothalassiaceae bacterium]
MAITGTADGAAGAARAIEIRRISAADMREALRRGVDDFLARPSHLIFLAAIYPVISFALFIVASGREFWPILWPLAAGFTLVGPIAAVGLMEISRERERGREVHWREALGVIGEGRLGPLVVLALVLLTIFIGWLVAAQALYVSLFGQPYGVTLPEFLHNLFFTPQGHSLIIWGNLVGGLFALLALVVSLVSFPMVVDGERDPVLAIITSVRAFFRNPGPVLLWGAVVAAAVFLSAMTAFVLLAIALPILGHATWHLYRRIVVRR